MSDDETYYDDDPIIENKDTKTKYIEVRTKLPLEHTNIDVITFATKEKSVMPISKREIPMWQNRGYLIPVDTNASSDDLPNLKIFSEISELMDIRYVKKGFAFVIPIQHNIKITDNMRLCLLW